MKQCTKCGETFPATAEYFYADKRGKSGLNSRCKDCCRERNRLLYETHPEEYSERNRLYSETHPEYNRLYSETHREDRREYHRLYRETHREDRREGNRLYRETHREEQRAYNRNRHARKRASPGTHTAADIQTQLKRQKGRCYYAACRHAKLGDTYHVEHVVPLSRDGWNDPSNIVIACSSCNLSKNTKRPHEWPEGGRLL